MAISNGDALLSVEQRSLPEKGEELQFFNVSYKASEYTLDIQIDGLEGITPYYIDTYTNTSTPLNEGWDTLNFSIDQDDEASIMSHRFKIAYEIDALSIDNVQNTEILMYPNPITNGSLTITASSLNGENARIILHTILGQSVYNTEVTFTDDKATIYNLNNLQAGVYIVTVESNIIKSTQKIIVK